MESFDVSEDIVSTADFLAGRILDHFLEFRRTHRDQPLCEPGCLACHRPHLPKVRTAILRGLPVTFVLPAFPGKSPNPSKVLGALPDLAEELALKFLNQLAEDVQAIYAPGAQIVLCSDGRVFSDIVGIPENDVTDYQRALAEMITRLNLTHLSTFNLDDWCGGVDFLRARQDLIKNFGSSIAKLRRKVARGATDAATLEDVEANRLYCGITRFLVEDAATPGQTQSRTAIQKDCKGRAYEVILRSNAWSKLIAEQFQDAVRLSIHPQLCGSSKIGIRLVGTDSWMTPWHGVAVQVSETSFVLMKRHAVEALGGQVKFSSDGRPSHFVLMAGPRASNAISDYRLGGMCELGV